MAHPMVPRARTDALSKVVVERQHASTPLTTRCKSLLID
jgi:hypothetical protein